MGKAVIEKKKWANFELINKLYYTFKLGSFFLVEQVWAPSQVN